ncbi:MAG: trypsin-like peptidase domain-containing protein [Pseudomonadales bacterium]
MSTEKSSQTRWQYINHNYTWPILAGLLLAALLLQLNRAPSSQTTLPLVTSYANAVQTALPSVVNIYTSRTVPAKSHPLLKDPVFKRFLNNQGIRQRDKVEQSLGSGVIISTDGYVLTNNHVINEADRIRVLLADGRERLATVIGSDAPTDLAVLKIELADLTPAIFADPNAIRIGDVVLAIGNPYGIGQTVTQGIVSATGRHGLQINTYEKYIQTDAAINKGNSGGALVNAYGQLIGINSGLYSKTGGSNGIGFAIPVDIASYVFQNIVEHGKVVRGWLGISAEEITPSVAEAFNLNGLRGLVLTNIEVNGPAAKAGLQIGDIITHIDETSVGNGNIGMHKIAQTKPGTKINIRAVRKGASQSFLVEIGLRPNKNSG